jgi:hypothetical protein
MSRIVGWLGSAFAANSALAVAAACGEQSVVADHGADGADHAVTPEASNIDVVGVSGEDVDARVEPFPMDGPVDVFHEAARPAACGLPDGSVREFTSLDAAYQAIVGRWLFCSGEPSNTLDRPIEFTADQHWYILTPDTSGQLQHPTGLAVLQDSGTFVLEIPGLGPTERSTEDVGASLQLFSLNLELDPLMGGSSLISNVSFSDVPVPTTPATSKMLFGPSVYVRAP